MADAGPVQYLIVFGICVGTTIISQLFRYFFGMKPEQSLDMQQKLRDMQEEMKAVQGDPVAMQRLQQEAMQSYRDMMRKTLIPNCIYSVLFIVLWAVFRKILEQYVFIFNLSFFFIYLFFSLGLNGIIALVRYIIKRSKKKKGQLPDENYDPALDRGIQSGLRFSPGWDKSLSTELKQMKTDLEDRRAKGQLPQDIDIDAEIQKMDEEEKEDNRSWKKRLEN